MLIIIDGYNFIFTVPALERDVGTNRIEPVREHIISLFSRYKEVKRYDVIVVFDGNYTQTTLPKKQFYSGITVIYSKSGINADTEIKNITTLCQNPNDVYIVTYDNEIKRLVPLMWTSSVFEIISLVMLWVPGIRKNEGTLSLACVLLFISLWIDKGFGLISGGFVPNPFEEVHTYWPTMPETMITIGVWAIGLLVLTFLYKIAITVREQTAGVEIDH